MKKKSSNTCRSSRLEEIHERAYANVLKSVAKVFVEVEADALYGGCLKKPLVVLPEVKGSFLHQTAKFIAACKSGKIT